MSLDERLRYLRFRDEDRACLAEIHAVVDPDLEAIVREFYAHLDRFEELRGFLSDPATKARLHLTLREYLQTLGLGIEKPEYAEQRLRVGVVHERIGLPVHWYLGAQSFLFTAIWERLRRRAGPRLSELVTTLHRVLTYDAELVLEAYHRAAMQRVETLLHELERAQQELQERSRKDHLTGALNRGAALESLDSELRRAQRFRQPFSVLVLDVDCFKAINDAHGHPFGDHVLARVVALCRGALRPWDVLGRLGGDELVVGLLACTGVEAARIAERVRAEVARDPFAQDGKTVAVTLSIGIAASEPAGAPAVEPLAALLESADRALYAAKQGGRNRVEAPRLRPA